MGNVVFQIEGLKYPQPCNDPARVEASKNALMPYGLVEEWSGNLRSGLINLSQAAAALHGIPYRECGLLTMTRCYHYKDRSSVLELFEKAATKASSFCFSTTIRLENDSTRPVFCMGRSINSGTNCPDAIVGIFIFPNVQ